MFGLTEPQYNIVKAQAKKCSTEIKGKIDGGKKYDHVAAEIITTHYSPIATLVSRLQFVWLCGYLNGQFGSGRTDYE